MPIVVAEKKKASSRGCVDRSGVNPIRRFPVRDDAVSESPAIPLIRGYKAFSAVVGNHYTIVVGSDVNSFRTRGMNRDRINL